MTSTGRRDIARDHIVDQLNATFVGLYGCIPEGVWMAPGRVNLIGEHTDYNEGFVLPFALPEATYIAAARREDGMLRVHSTVKKETVEAEVSALAPGTVAGWAAYVAGVFWSLREAGYGVGGADLAIETEVPQGAGLSSSAALECSTAVAAAELYGHAIEPLKLTRIAQRAENDFVGMPCGLMDQTVAMLGRTGHLVQFDNRNLATKLVPFKAEGAEILVIDTQAPHRLIDGEYAARRQQCEQATEQLGLGSLRELNDAREQPTAQRLQVALNTLEDEVLRRRVRHVVTENQRVLETVEALRAGDLVTVGKQMTASHVSLRDDYEVTVPEVNLAQEILVTGGAFGARITGGGFGGCVIALVRTEDTERLKGEVVAAYAKAGHATPKSFVAVPSKGAHRL